MKAKKRPSNLKIKKPKEFLCEEKKMLFTEANIKRIAKDFNLTYRLDYVNAKVIFTEIEQVVIGNGNK